MANKKVTITYNGSQILPETELTSSAIIYNGTALASDFVGTKTLNCNGQVMVSNVVVGSKTLNCNGLLMNSNVSVISIGLVGNKPTNLYPSATYNGSGIGNGYTTPANVTMTGNNSGTNAGTYTATYIPNTGYCWNDGTTSVVTVTLTINRASVGGKPSGATYNYTGGWFSPYNIPSGVNSSGTTSAYAGGNYTAYYAPDGNHCWSDNTYSTVTVSWTIQYVWNKYNSVPYYSYASQDYYFERLGDEQQVLTSKSDAVRASQRVVRDSPSDLFDSSTGLFTLEVRSSSSNYTLIDSGAYGTNVSNLASDIVQCSEIIADINTTSRGVTLYANGIASSNARDMTIRKYSSYLDHYNQGSTHYGTVQNVSKIYPDNGRHSDGYWYVKTW